MKKVITTTIFCLLIYFLPIYSKPELFFEPQLIVVVLFFYIIFFTQPTFNSKEIKTNSKTDKYSMVVIAIGLFITLISSVIEWAYFSVAISKLQSSIYLISGLVFLILGTYIRVSAIQQLGKHFTNAVAFDKEHKLIKEGPYKIIRHPSYLGAYVAILGSTLFLYSKYSFLLGSIVMLIAYFYRIKIEESGLKEMFPKEYEAYMKETKKLIPFIY